MFAAIRASSLGGLPFGLKRDIAPAPSQQKRQYAKCLRDQPYSRNQPALRATVMLLESGIQSAKACLRLNTTYARVFTLG